MYHTIDLFCGCGGFSYGAYKSGFCNIVGSVDFWDKATESYKLNFPDAITFTKKVEEVNDSEISQWGKVDVILASPECTNHSCLRSSRPPNEYSLNQPFMITRYIDKLKPRWVVVENVVQLLRWKYFNDWVREIEFLGYYHKVYKLNAQDYNVPQDRRRCFVIFCKTKFDLDLDQYKSYHKPFYNVLKYTQEKYQFPFRVLDENSVCYRTYEKYKLAKQLFGDESDFLISYRFAGTPELYKKGVRTVWRPTWTITTTGLPLYVKYFHDEKIHKMRMVKWIEALYGMGFDSEFKLPSCVTKEKMRLIGNAVCPPVSKVILTEIAKFDGLIK